MESMGIVGSMDMAARSMEISVRPQRSEAIPRRALEKPYIRSLRTNEQVWCHVRYLKLQEIIVATAKNELFAWLKIRQPWGTIVKCRTDKVIPIALSSSETYRSSNSGVVLDRH